mmetsp:Transcript_61005/g.107169  ORF Transcript_61005/g.107169 Transcript_61005/m.107169 type:complete len:429 (-) Transcript_61005:54-1340(-)|eukprot:CAMPEP_0184977236 /NCGR_PEP_ID=MMETSP1098-20130426/7956_1 /TAXON_ID=89044 /ORGANISM="Spumella elongata, Strain CCAP 955/1" /LENGTH=428 /DNA_ID=CAMNT_0027500201 /DNA_START=14 /DNA_END=1300 /DNA_ORIENTATION=+
MIVSFGEKFELSEKIGSGSFGEIFFTRNIKTGENVATKSEKKSKKAKSQLRREAKIYLMLSGTVGIPSVKWFGETPDKYLLVMELLGQSLEDLFNYCGRVFSLKTILLLAYELVSRVESVHSVGKLLHRDIKPENFLIGRGRERHTVYIIDFGLAKHYCNPDTGKHIPLKEGNSLTGTARYASINAHLGLEQSRRDDLFSVGYVLMYFLRGGSLPWQGLKTKAQLAEEARESQHTGSPQKHAQVTETETELLMQQLNLGTSEPFLSSAQVTPRIGQATGATNVADVVLKKDEKEATTGKAAVAEALVSKNVRRETEDQEKYRLILEKKKATSLDELCAEHPEEFRKYFDHLLTLSFEDTPDYAYLKSLFRDLFRKHKYAYDSVLYDWEVLSTTGVHPGKPQSIPAPVVTKTNHNVGAIGSDRNNRRKN